MVTSVLDQEIMLQCYENLHVVDEQKVLDHTRIDPEVILVAQETSGIDQGVGDNVHTRDGVRFSN